jgi:hypothetical protein
VGGRLLCEPFPHGNGYGRYFYLQSVPEAYYKSPFSCRSAPFAEGDLNWFVSGAGDFFAQEGAILCVLIARSRERDRSEMANSWLGDAQIGAETRHCFDMPCNAVIDRRG